MRVKASGYELSQAVEQDIFSSVNHESIREAVISGSQNPLAGNFVESHLQPSMETTLHAVMPHRVVLHTHSISSVATCCRSDAETVFRERIEGYNWAFIDYAQPGMSLANLVLEALDSQPNLDVLFLANHGIVVGAHDATEAGLIVEAVDNMLRLPERNCTVSTNDGDLSATAGRNNLVLPASAEVHSLALDPISIRFATEGSLYPDHVVFLGPAAGALPDRKKSADVSGPLRTKLWISAGEGVFLEPNLSGTCQVMALMLARVVAQFPHDARLNYLSESDEFALHGMEEEEHRRNISMRNR